MRQFVVLCAGLAFLIANGLNEVSGQTPKQKEEVEGLVKALKTSKDPKTRVSAANQLTELGTVRTVLMRAAEPALIAALKDDNGEVRQAVVATLGLLEPYTKERIPALLPLLADNQPRGARLEGRAAVLRHFLHAVVHLLADR